MLCTGRDKIIIAIKIYETVVLLLFIYFTNNYSIIVRQIFV